MGGSDELLARYDDDLRLFNAKREQFWSSFGKSETRKTSEAKMTKSAEQQFMENNGITVCTVDDDNGGKSELELTLACLDATIARLRNGSYNHLDESTTKKMNLFFDDDAKNYGRFRFRIRCGTHFAIVDENTGEIDFVISAVEVSGKSGKVLYDYIADKIAAVREGVEKGLWGKAIRLAWLENEKEKGRNSQAATLLFKKHGNAAYDKVEELTNFKKIFKKGEKGYNKGEKVYKDALKAAVEKWKNGLAVGVYDRLLAKHNEDIKLKKVKADAKKVARLAALKA